MKKKFLSALCLMFTLPVAVLGQQISGVPQAWNFQGFNDQKQISTPSTNPASGYLRMYAKTASTICVLTNTGVETCFSASAANVPWSGITNPTGTLSLSMAGYTSTLNFTSALAQALALKNTTAAIVSLSQGSPVLATCGRAWTTADAEDCMTLSELPGNGANAPIAFNLGHTGTSSGVVSLYVNGVNMLKNPFSVQGQVLISDASSQPAATSADANANHILHAGGTPGFSALATADFPAFALNAPLYGTGSAGAPGAAAPPTTPNGVPEFFISTPSGSAATAPTFSLAGVPIDEANPATLLVTDRANYLNWTAGTALALPAITGSFASNFPFIIKNTSTTLTLTPNVGVNDLIDGATTGTILPNVAAFVYQDSSAAPGHWFTVKFPTFAAFPACADSTGNHLNFSTTAGFSCGTSTPASPTFTAPVLGNATATSLLATGIVDGLASVNNTTTTACTLGVAASNCGTLNFQTGMTYNQEATAGAGVTYSLPATVKGMVLCVENSAVSGTGAPDTGILTVYPPASSYVILKGTVNTVGGGTTHGVVSSGAAGDAACFIANDATHWTVKTSSGVWSLN
jgi:hypothetical protein